MFAKNLSALGAALLLCGGMLVACAPTAPDEEVASLEREVKSRIFCGGIAGIPCPDGMVCVDDPRDDCDPRRGGADCGGYCKKAPSKGRKCKDSATKTYVGHSPEECQVIRFTCVDGWEYFADQCGCGCQQVERVQCGPNLCPRGEVCCNESCGICTPPGGACTEQFCVQEECRSDADCRAFSDYCDGCNCRALSSDEPDPTCGGQIVNCFADPCMNQTATCVRGQCLLTSTQ